MTSVSTDRRNGVNGGLAIKVPCRAASTANLVLNGEKNVDGVALVTGDRCLVKNQTSSVDNGIYVVDTGDWTRAVDCDGINDLVFGTLVKVNSGTQLGFWYQATTGTITVDTTANTWSQASSTLAIVSVYMQTVLVAATAAAARALLGFSAYFDTLVNAASAAALRALFTPLTTKGDLWVFGAADTRKAVGTDGYVFQALSGSADGLYYGPPGLGYSLVGGYLDWTVAGNVLTVAAKTWAGNDPSATEPVYYAVRDVTPATGLPLYRKLTAALSVTLANTALAGTVNNVPFTLWGAIFNDAGTDRLAIANCLTTVAGPGSGRDVTALNTLGLGAWGIGSATLSDAASDNSQVFYANAAIAAKAYATVGYAKWEAGLPAAGVWTAAPTRKQLFGPGVFLPGQIVQFQRNDTGAVATGTTVTPDDDSIPQITEGDQAISQAITPSSAANVLLWEAKAWAANSAAGDGQIALFQDATANALKSGLQNAGAAGITQALSLSHCMLAATSVATTGKVRIGYGSAGTTTVNGAASARKHGGTLNTYLQCMEIMA